MTNAVCVWDFTISKNHTDQNLLKVRLQKIAKKWCFQLEMGETGYEHYQGRFSLKIKKRLPQCKELFFSEAHLSITSNENKKNMFYVMKDETRVDGPWADTDKEIYIPRQYRGKLDTLRPFQKQIWDSYDEFEPRIVDCVINTRGNIGKSDCASLCELYGRGIDIPPMNDFEKIIESLCDLLIAKRERIPGIIFIDIPKAIPQNKLAGMYAAIEQIKKGKVYDIRYKYREWWFDSPRVWVFCNTQPSLQYLSRDRWQFWEINDALELVPYSQDLNEDLEALWL